MECQELSGVVLPEMITEIGRRAFYKCGNLTEIKIPQSVERIEREAFYQTGLQAGTSSKAEIYWRERFSEVQKSGICPGSGICGNCGKMGVSRVQYVENSGIFRGSRSAGRMDHK